jgi:hypothetical protein
MAFLPEFESVKGKTDKKKIQENHGISDEKTMEKPWKTGNRPPMVPPKVSPCQAKDLSLAADRS